MTLQMFLLQMYDWFGFKCTPSTGNVMTDGNIIGEYLCVCEREIDKEVKWMLWKSITLSTRGCRVMNPRGNKSKRMPRIVTHLKNSLPSLYHLTEFNFVWPMLYVQVSVTTSFTSAIWGTEMPVIVKAHSS